MKISRPVVSEESSLASKCMKVHESAYNFGHLGEGLLLLHQDGKHLLILPDQENQPFYPKEELFEKTKVLASKDKLQDKAMEKPADISVILDINNAQDVILAQKDDLCASPFKCDQCDFSTKIS